MSLYGYSRSGDLYVKIDVMTPINGRKYASLNDLDPRDATPLDPTDQLAVWAGTQAIRFYAWPWRRTHLEIELEPHPGWDKQLISLILAISGDDTTRSYSRGFI